MESEGRFEVGPNDNEGVSGADLLDGVRPWRHDGHNSSHHGRRDIRDVCAQLRLVPYRRAGKQPILA